MTLDWEESEMKKLLFLGLSASSFYWYGCGMLEEDEKDEEASSAGSVVASSDSTANSSAVTSSNPMAMLTPGSLSLSLAPEQSGTSLTAAEKSKTIRQKSDDVQDILKGKAESCLPPIFNKQKAELSEVKCYEFDQEMIYGTNPGGNI